MPIINYRSHSQICGSNQRKPKTETKKLLQELSAA
ncbi:hypothetical protein MTBLM5_500001 [Magnetospirillum sp. LM-5]|nr:hypothetical protein MTBLM5_500001 [Magnetospirillum sp. LM-5]